MSDTVTVTDLYGASWEFAKKLLVPRTSVYGVVFHEGNILLSPQVEDNCYDLPGGGLEDNETEEQAVIREVKEETGLDVEVIDFIGEDHSYFFPRHDPKNPQGWDSTLKYYLCRFKGGEFSTEGFDEYEKQYVRMAEWVSLARLDDIKLASSVDYRKQVRKAERIKK